VEETVVVAAAGDAEAALRWAAEGAAVIVAGTDAEVVGALVARLRDGGARVAGFVGYAGEEAVTEMAGELFPGCRVVIEP
jgi:hypothetical protein